MQMAGSMRGEFQHGRTAHAPMGDEERTKSLVGYVEGEERWDRLFYRMF